MSTAKSLSDDQIAKIRSWVDAGDGFSELQSHLAEEMDIKVTYLETRFLLEDLKIELKQPPKPEPEPEPEEEDSPEAAPEADADAEADADSEPETPDAGDSPDEETPAEDVNVSVTIDTVLRPDALISGRVDFGGGKGAAWWLDQMGRLGMDADDPEFRPSEAQAMAFQKELQTAVQSSGI